MQMSKEFSVQRGASGSRKPLLYHLFRPALAGLFGVLLGLSVQGSAWSEEVYTFYGKLDLSPDGQELLFQGYGRSGFGDVIQLRIDPQSGGHVLSFPCHYLADRAEYAPDGSAIVVALTLMFDDPSKGYSLIIGLNRETGETMFENPITTGGNYLHDMVLSPDGAAAYLAQEQRPDDPQILIHDLTTQQSSVVYENGSFDALSQFGGSADGQVFVWANKTYATLNDTDKERLGFPALSPDDQPRLLFETTDDPSALRVSSIYPALRGILGETLDETWGGIVDELELKFRHEHGISYVSFRRPDALSELPRFGIYGLAGETLDLILDVGAPIRDFSVSPDGSRIAVIHRVPKGDGEFELRDTITYFERGEDKAWVSTSLEDAISNISKDDACQQQ
jgi:hypothetical protein